MLFVTSRPVDVFTFKREKGARFPSLAFDDHVPVLFSRSFLSAGDLNDPGWLYKHGLQNEVSLAPQKHGNPPKHNRP